MKILNFGSLNIDMVYDVEHIVTPGETISSLNMQLFPGGKGLNQSLAVRRAGGEIYHAGCIGDDGKMLSNLLLDNGVNLKHLKTIPQKTGHAVIQVEKSGENSILLFAGANHQVTTDFIDEVLSDFSKDDVLVLQNEISNLPYIVKTAAQKGMKIFLNPSPINEVINEIDFNDIYCLVLNEIEAECISKMNIANFKEWVNENYPNLKVMLTLGKNGCRFIDGEKITEHPIFNVDVVDTTAAGDTFTGYFVVGFCREEPIEKVLRFASAASALAVSKKGAASSIPSLSEVAEFLENKN
ncbi:MAG: ribokinase [Ruminococcaceae bacterium]|nr:ribokinase [Oscillospiraceae bacterium]